MTSKIFYSPAKINLFLKVINKRKDGYHNLQSLFTYIDLYDEIRQSRAKAMMAGAKAQKGIYA